jgi:hypothetical protein
METGKAWPRQPVAKVTCWGHQRSKTSLTEEPGSFVSVGASLVREPLPFKAGSKRLTHWTSETVYWSEAAWRPYIGVEEKHTCNKSNINFYNRTFT